MKTTFSTLCCLLLAITHCFAQGVFEAQLSGSILGGPASFVAGIGYFRVADTTVDYRLVVYDLTASSLSPVIATASFETSFTTSVGEVITVRGCDLFPANPFLPPSGPPGPYTCPAQSDWADYWGSFTLPAEQVGELFSDGGILRIQVSGGAEIQGLITPVPEPSSMVLLALGLSWFIGRWKAQPVERMRHPPSSDDHRID